MVCVGLLYELGNVSVATAVVGFHEEALKLSISVKVHQSASQGYLKDRIGHNVGLQAPISIQ